MRPRRSRSIFLRSSSLGYLQRDDYVEVVMEPSLTLFLAAIVFGAGFAIGQAAINALIGALNRNR